MDTLISLTKTQKILSSIEIKTLEKKNVPIFKAYGRTLAQDIIAPINVPHFNRAAMDGYAIRAQDSLNASPDSPNTLEIMGELINGKQAIKEIEPGKAVKIYTGCIMPQGANAVVKIEDVEEHNNYIKLFKSITVGKNVSYKGEDIRYGSLVLSKGSTLKSYHIGILASLNLKYVPVFKKPTVSIIATGNELIEVGNNITTPKIINSNSPMLYAALKELNCNVLYLGISKDDEYQFKEKLIFAVSRSDAVITIGGMSIGKMDIVSRVVGKIGKILFHGVKIKPGKPCGAAIISNKPILMLPGYPVASLLTFNKFFPIILSKLMDGSKIPIKNIRHTVTIEEDINTPKRLTYFIKLHVNSHTAKQIKSAGSGILSSMLETNAIIEVPESINKIKHGETIECNILG